MSGEDHQPAQGGHVVGDVPAGREREQVHGGVTYMADSPLGIGDSPQRC